MFSSHSEGSKALRRGAAALALLLLAVPAGAAALYPGLLMPTSGTHPDAVATGDFNGDGILDFAVVSYADETVSVLLGNGSGGVGDGTTRVASTFAVGGEPWDIVAADLNGNGVLDLAVVEGLENRVSIWFANKVGTTGNGTFWEGPKPGTWEYPVAVLAADLNGDGTTDLATANYWSDNVSLFGNNGTGGFSSLGVLDVGSRPIDVAVGDFNGDAVNDLAVLNFLSDDVHAFVGEEGGTLALQGVYEAGPRPVAMTTAALGDGKSDLAIANYYDNQVSLLRTSNSAQAQGFLFGPRSGLTAEGAPRRVLLTEISGDTFPDLVTVLEAKDEIQVRLGAAGGNFSSAQRSFYAGFRPLDVVAGDVDGDNIRDLIVSTHWNHGLLVLNGLPNSTGGPTGSFEPSRVGVGSVPMDVLLVDLTQDGALDLVTLNSGSDDVYVKRHVGPPLWFASTPDLEGTGPRPEDLAMGNFTTDAIPDLAAVNSQTNLLSIFPTADVVASPGEDLIGSEIRVPVGAEPYHLEVGDFEADGDDDIITYGRALGRIDLVRIIPAAEFNANSVRSPISLAVGPSDANRFANLIFGAADSLTQTGWAVAMGGDVNGDGHPDMLVGAPGEDRARVYYGGAQPDSLRDLLLGGPTGSRFGAAVAFVDDIDGDGDDEILVGAPAAEPAGPNSGAAYLYLGGDDALADITEFGTQEGEEFGTAVAGGFDYDGDGNGDWAVGAPGYDGDAGELVGRVRLYRGGAVQGGADATLVGEAADSRFGQALSPAGDFTGDGLDDLLVGSPEYDAADLTNAGRVYVYAGTSSGTPVVEATFTGQGSTARLGTAVAGLGDYNGDASDDIALGAPGLDTDSGADRGAVYIHYGGVGFDTAADVTFNGRQVASGMGAVVAPAGRPRGGQGGSGIIISSPGYTSTTAQDPEDRIYGRVEVFAAGARSSDTPLVTIDGKVEGAGFGRAVAGGADVNQDGYSDWMIGAPTDGTEGEDAGRAFCYQGGRGSIPGPGSIARGDFNGDGLDDLVATNEASGEVSILLNQDLPTFVDPNRPVTHAWVEDGTPARAVAGDLDGDGLDDLVVIRKSQEDAVVYRSNGDGTFAELGTHALGPAIVGFPLAPTRAYLEDVTGEGDPDLLVTLSAWGAAAVLAGDGAGGLGAYQYYVSGGLSSALALGDVNEDGHLDMILADRLNSQVGLHFHRDGVGAKDFATDAPETPRPGVAPLLAQNFPNPFNPKTIIRFDLPTDSRAELVVYDVRGREVVTLVDQDLTAGRHSIEWSGRDGGGGEVSAGVYFYRLSVDGDVTGQRKMVLVK